MVGLNTEIKKKNRERLELKEKKRKEAVKELKKKYQNSSRLSPVFIYQLKKILKEGMKYEYA